MNMEVDVNYLLHRQQISLMCAERSASAAGKVAYENMARGYGERVAAYRQANLRSVDLVH